MNHTHEGYCSYQRKYPDVASIQRAMRQSNIVGRKSVERMFDAVINAVDEHQGLLANRAEILSALNAGSPAITGVSTIGSSIIGQLLLVNVNTMNGLIFGSGAVVLKEEDVIPDGAVVMLRNGEVLTCIDDVMTHVLGVFKDNGDFNESDN